MALLRTLLNNSTALKQQGFWDASTNTPTLANGNGTIGYYYVVSVGGTVDFGAGNITFTVGDWVYYNTANEWVKFETGVSYTPEDVANKATTFGTVNDILYPSVKAVNDQLTLKVNKAGDTMTGTLTMSGAAINEANFVTVASATTCDIGAANSNNVAISGTTTITSFGTAAAGVTRRCRATGAFLITYNATSLITANGKNITTKVDDCFTMTSLGSGNWIMTAFKPADGRILANAINNQTGTSYTVALTDIGNDITLSNASAITTTLPAANTFPIGAKIKVINLGVGTNTFVKTGADTLLGNTTLIQYGVAELEVLSSTTWQISYATATIVEQASVCIDGTLTNDKVYDVFSAPDNVTIIGFSLRNTSAGTAGTYTAKINGTNITGLVGIANTTTRTNTAPTAANTMTYQQVLQYVPTGMTSVVDAFITVFYTRQY